MEIFRALRDMSHLRSGLKDGFIPIGFLSTLSPLLETF